ncbi:MAG: DEAD/DEAH box helicase, partial [Pontimonas sp.]
MSTPSPAEKFQAARSRSMHPQLEAFRGNLGFDLDPFQVASCESVEDGRGVLVAAPTGAGKTIVAEFAVHLAMRQARVKVFYTTPMKALSNQKFQELVATYGSEEVGLLTGDSSINPRARIVIMTTEVLRNMLYA